MNNKGGSNKAILELSQTSKQERNDETFGTEVTNPAEENMRLNELRMDYGTMEHASHIHKINN